MRAARSCWCSQWTRTARERGDAVLALDAVDAGIGDRVLVVQEGYSAMTAAGRPGSPIDMTIVGVVDAVEMTE